jgi:tetratricopeptide (TPR) repeat protein
MSYINDALRKAQKERDSRYARLSSIIPPGLNEPGRSRKRRLTVVTAVVLFFLIPAGLLLALYVRDQPSFINKGTQQPAASENPAPLPLATRQEATETVQGGTVRREAPAEVRYREALSAQRKGDRRRAEALYRQTLAIDPAHVQALNNLGVLCMEEQKGEQAIALFGKAIVLKRDYVDPYYNLACLYARKNEIDESLWYLKVAMTISDEVKNWVMKDADMENVVASPAFKKIMEGQKN